MILPALKTSALSLLLSASLLPHATAQAPSPKQKQESKQKKNSTKKPKTDKTATPQAYISVHPFFALEDVAPASREIMKIGGMCFVGDTIYATAFSPDRLDKSPDRKGRILRIENATHSGTNKQETKVTVLCDWLYEPCAIAVVGDSIYVGEKDRIIRFDDGIKKNELKKGEEVVLLDGASTANFHTYTVGFEPYIKDGKDYLCANFTTAIVMGGKRDVMEPPNPKVLRGSTFILGPVTGSEDPDSVEIEYLAGGYRTPNGIETGPNNEVWVTDNQGIFNPANKLIRVENGNFYGHYLLTDGGRAAAYQPNNVDPVKGSPKGQSPATIYLPQGIVARSPAQPIVLRDEKGILEPYNDQLLLCEFTSGRLLRVFSEEVDGVWQGVVFQHSGGPAHKSGKGGFTAGPNRIEQGPDGNYYIGQIGAGNLWTYNQTDFGLQRLRVKSQEEVPADFNEILAVRVVEGGFELEFLKPIPKSSIDLKKIQITQWTYFPSSRYGGSNQGTIKLKPQSITLDESGRKATLIINGLKDGSPKYVISKGGQSNANTGYVVHVKFDPRADDQSLLYTKEFWYTLHRKRGGKDAKKGDTIQLTKQEITKQRYNNLCLSCHVERDGGWAAPKLEGILGRKQTVLRNGAEVEITVDRNYLINAILNPEAEKTVQFKDAVMPPLGLSRDVAAEMADFIIGLKSAEKK
ncbi:hypothetical protein N9891_00745 [bacterium]|nr:hypothetical protein [bacterium]